MNHHERLTTILRGGDVRRYHIEPVVGHQSVAEHTWRALQILLVARGDRMILPPLLLALLHHDVPEGCVGDLSYQVKQKFPLLSEQLDAAEAEAMDALGLHQNLHPVDTLWLAFADRAEGLYFGLDQRRLGNLHAAKWNARSWPKVWEILGQLDEALQPTTCARALLDEFHQAWVEAHGEAL